MSNHSQDGISAWIIEELGGWWQGAIVRKFGFRGVISHKDEDGWWWVGDDLDIELCAPTSRLSLCLVTADDPEGANEAVLMHRVARMLGASDPRALNLSEVLTLIWEFDPTLYLDQAALTQRERLVFAASTIARRRRLARRVGMVVGPKGSPTLTLEQSTGCLAWVLRHGDYVRWFYDRRDIGPGGLNGLYECESDPTLALTAIELALKIEP